MAIKLLIDADVLVYEAAGAAQKTIYEYKGNSFKSHDDWLAYCQKNELDAKAIRKAQELQTHVEILPDIVAKNICRHKLNEILEACGTQNHELILSGEGNYRNDVAVTKGYKANRADTPKPHHYELARLMFMDMGADVVNGIEADDAIGISASQDPKAVVCTIDKDLNQIPGKHYDWGKKLKYTVKVPDAHYWFMRQLLTGDSTDNIPGIPGMGEVRAKAILDDVRGDIRTMWGRVKEEYAKAPFKMRDGSKTAGQPDYINEQGCLLWIQRYADQRWTMDTYEDEYVNRLK